MPSDATTTSQARRNRVVEAVGLGMLAVLPLVPYVTFILATGVPRFGLVGDHAFAEHAARHVFSGDTLLGTPSRFGWSQPGPLFFVIAAPFVSLFGAAGIYVAACFTNAAAAGMLVAGARIFARRAHAVAALFVMLGWFAAFGDGAADPWAPLVVALPLTAFLVHAALLARGKSAAAFPAVFFGAFAAQTHVAAVSTVVAASIVALAAFYVGHRRRETAVAWNEGARLAIAGAIALLLFVPPLVEQLFAPTGNLRRIWGFFVHREAPLGSLSSAASGWMTALAWMPARLAHLTITSEAFVPLFARSAALPDAGAFPTVITAVHFGIGCLALVVALGRKDTASLSLLGFALLGDAIAIGALQAIVGPSSTFLFFWTTASSTVGWIGIISAFFSAIGAFALRQPRLSGIAAPALVLLGLGGAAGAATVQRFWLAHHPDAPSSRPDLRPTLADIHAAIRERAAKESATPVVHIDGDVAIGIFLELEKDGDTRLAGASYPGARSDSGLARALHVWVAIAPAKPKVAECTEPLVKGELLVYLRATAVCP